MRKGVLRISAYMGTPIALHRSFDVSIVLSTSNNEALALFACIIPIVRSTLKSETTLVGYF